MNITKQYLVDLAERAGWTLAECAVSFATVELADLNTVYAPIIATGLAVLKGYVAKHVGNKDSASTAPSV